MSEKQKQSSHKHCYQHYDLLIVGGGMIGTVTAIALAQGGFSVALIESATAKKSRHQKQNQPQVPSQGFDQKALALSAASVAILNALGLWEKLAASACPIKQIHVSDQGHFGFTRLNINDYGINAFGQVVCLQEIAPLLWQTVEQQKRVDIYYSSALQTITREANNQQIQFINDKNQTIQLSAQLIIAADGTQSSIAKKAGISYQQKSYSQTALVTNIRCELAHNNRAFERFTANGPLALLPLNDRLPLNDQLPLNDRLMNLVWCQKTAQSEQIKHCAEDEFIQRLQLAFGYRLGKIQQIGERICYPINLHLATKPFTKGILLLGNSAHTLHPIAGQGFNLGLRDVATLVQLLADAKMRREDFSSEIFLERFIRQRSNDWQISVLATDSLARLFSQTFLPLVLLRNSGMNLINQLPFIKKQLAFTAMGFHGQASRLARGLPVQPIQEHLK